MFINVKLVKDKEQCFILINNSLSVEEFSKMNCNDFINLSKNKVGIYSFPIEFYEIFKDENNEYTITVMGLLIDLYLNSYNIVDTVEYKNIIDNSKITIN